MSVLDQTYPVHEILVYDDASTIDPHPYIDKLTCLHENIKLIRAKENRGAGYARNHLLQNVSGELVAFLDDDDYWYPDKISKQLSLLQSSKADIVISDYHILFGDDTMQTKITPRIITKNMMVARNWIPMSMALVSTNLIGWREMVDLRTRQDYAYWIKLFDLNEKLYCVSVDSPMGVYTKRSGSLSSNYTKNIIANYNMYRKALRMSPVKAAFRTLINIASKIKEFV